MKKLILFLIFIILLSPLFSQGLKEKALKEKKDEILSSNPSKISFSLPFPEDRIERDKILSTPSYPSPTLSLRHYYSHKNAFVEYGLDYLDYHLSVENEVIELRVREEGATILLNGVVVDKETLRENMALFQNAYEEITTILSSPIVSTRETLSYEGENWRSTLSWTEGERSVYSLLSFVSNGTLWEIRGHIEKDKIPSSFSPTTLFRAPYFVVESVTKDGEERNKALW